MTLSWNELACHGLLKKIDREVVTLIMVHLRPLRKKWIKDYGEGEVEKYIIENRIHGKRELFETPYISKEMWCKAALRREFKAQWWWRAPEKRREKCYNVVNASITRYSASTWGPQPIMGMPDELLKNENCSIARDYLKHRSLNKDQVKKFKIGYVDKNPNFFEKLKKDFSTEEIIETGLFYLDERKKIYVERFRGRLIFPINNISGQPIALGGRIIKKSDFLVL